MSVGNKAILFLEKVVLQMNLLIVLSADFFASALMLDQVITFY